MADNPLLITNADITGVLKNVYESFRVDAFPMLTPLLAAVKKGSAGGPESLRWGGNGVYWDVVLTRPVGMTASQSGYFPPTAQTIERQATLGIKRTYVQRQIDRLAVFGTQSKEAAFIPLAKKVAKEAVAAATLGQQEVLHGDGRGIKALIGTVTDTDTIVVTSPYGVSGAGQGGLLLDAGMYIAVLDDSDSFATVLGRAYITSTSNSGDNCTLELGSAIAGMATGDAVVACTPSDTSFNNYPNGLINILNRGGSYDNFEGINAATANQQRWNTTRLTAGTDTDSASQFAEMDLWHLAQLIAAKSGKDAMQKPGEFLCQTTMGLRRNLAESFFGQRRLTPSDFVKIKGGFKAIEVSGIPVVADTWNPAGTVYLVHLPSLTWVDRQDWEKVQYEDSGAWRPIPGRDAFEINWAAYWNFGCLQRNPHGMITGFTDSNRYTHVV